MRSLALFGLGLGFFLMGAGLYALTLRKAKAPPAHPTKTQQREQAELTAENKKMRLGAGLAAGLGLLLIGVAYL
jgi:hypothetical protein